MVHGGINNLPENLKTVNRPFTDFRGKRIQLKSVLSIVSCKTFRKFRCKTSQLLIYLIVRSVLEEISVRYRQRWSHEF